MKVSDNSSPQIVDSQNPWPGLDYFVEENRAFFHGRDAEADLLLTMVRHRLLTVLYGQSGLGKSSLLQAGLFPRLRRDRMLPVYIRLRHADADGLSTTDPGALVAQTRQFIRDAIVEAVEAGQLVVPATNEEGGSDGESQSPAPRDDETLWEYLHRKASGLQAPNGDRVAPVLVFDQFEEIFTVGRSETHQAMRRTFLHDLADCVENRLPERVLQEMNRQPRQTDEKYANLDFNRQDYRIVLSLREDYLAELHDLADLFPSIHENQTRLLPLNGWQALDAVSIPGESLIEPVLAREIVEIVAASGRGDADQATAGAAATSSDGQGTDESKLEVDPALLSMVCRELNIERQRRQQPKITQAIADDLLKTRGRSILRRFYTECFESLPDQAAVPAVQKFVEEELLTPAGYRNMVELVRAQHRLERSGVENSSAAIQQLIHQRLLRISERRQDKTKWLELTHDVLCDVVKESRHEREIREAKEREEHSERERAARQLQEMERQRAQAQTMADEAQKREADAVEGMRRLRRERQLGIAAMVLLILFAGSLCVAAFLAFGRFKAGSEAQKRSVSLLDSAKNRLRQPKDERQDVFALRQLARAIRIDPGRAEAAKLACELLAEKDWSPPLSQSLKYPGSPLAAVSFSPDNREVVAVAQDGNLIRWRADDYSELPAVRLVPDKMKSENKFIISSAAFSPDRRRIVASLFPPNRENGRVFNWSEEAHTYDPRAVTVECKDTMRSAAWRHDGNTIYIFPLRFDQSVCRIFQLEDNVFKEKGNIPNVTAGDLSADDRWLAVGGLAGRIQILDAHTGQVQPETSETKSTFEPPDANPERRFFSLIFDSERQKIAATSMREPGRIWDLRTGTSTLLKSKSDQLQVLRIAFSPSAAEQARVAAGFNGMIGLWNMDRLDQLRSEPMCLPDTMVYPVFSPDGTKLLSFSGSFWQAMDTVRAWDISPRKPPLEHSATRFTGKSPPKWLSELAEAVTGLRGSGDEDEPPPMLLSALKVKYGEKPVTGEYAPIWERFLANH